MAFVLENLVAVGGQSTKGRGPQIWSYATADATATVDTSGYFNNAAGLLAVGDLIIRTSFTDGTFATLSTQGFHTVSSNTGTVVDVNDTLAVTATDTD